MEAYCKVTFLPGLLNNYIHGGIVTTFELLVITFEMGITSKEDQNL